MRKRVRRVHGVGKKYSSGLWDLAGTTFNEAGGPLLEASEERMLDLYVQRGEIGPSNSVHPGQNEHCYTEVSS